jgi:hypothetical protein
MRRRIGGTHRSISALMCRCRENAGDKVCHGSGGVIPRRSA